jgi:hypothetical protein
MLCFLFFTPSAVWLLYVLRRTITHKLQFVTHMPTSGVDIQLPVPLDRFDTSHSQVETGIHVGEGGRTGWKPPGSIHPPPSCLSFGGRESGSGDTTPTSAAFLASERHEIALALAPTIDTQGAEHRVVSPTSPGHIGLENERDYSRRPHDPGGGPWELNVSTSAKAAKKLQTAYC